MNRFAYAGCTMMLVAAVAGCSSTKVTTDPVDTGSRKLAKPSQIIVYDFAASLDDLPVEARGGDYNAPSTPPSDAHEAAGRQLGEALAAQLVADINDMGLHGVHGDRSTNARVGDIVIMGHFESVDEGSAAKRMAIGFGSGKAEVKTVVAGYVMTSKGLRRVGGGSVDAGGAKGPGLFVPVIVTAATANPIGLVVSGAVKAEGEISGRTKASGAVKRTGDAISERLEARFKQEGWI